MGQIQTEAKTKGCKLDPMLKKLLFALTLLCIPALAQTTKVAPDCVINFSFTATGSTSNSTCGNNTLGISNWIVAYGSTGYSAVSLVVQSAPDVSGAPGSWVTFAGTVYTSTQYPGSSGVNPNTAITSANTGFAGYFPWMRVTLSSVTGTGKVSGSLYGFLNSTLAKAGGGGGGSTVVIAGTANEITVSGVGCSGATGTCTISIPSDAIFPGNPSTPGSFSTGDVIDSGVGSGKAGAHDFQNGTVQAIGGNSFGIGVGPTMTTSQRLQSPNAIASAHSTMIVGAPASNISTWSYQPVPDCATDGSHAITFTQSTDAWSCTAISGGGGTEGGGVLGYSATGIILPTAGTTFVPPVGGAIASTTESNVTAKAPAAAPVSNMFVSISAAPGTGNTIAFTFRDAGSSTAVTCTISGATATSCQDVTHTFTPVVGDALAIQIVTTGTVIIAPNVKIIAEYGVTGSGGGPTFSNPYMISGGNSYFQPGPLTVPPSLASWVPTNQGSATITNVNGAVLVFGPAQSGDNLRLFCSNLTYPTTPWASRWTVGIVSNFVGSNFFVGGIAISDGTKYQTFGVGQINNTGYTLANWNSVSSNAAAQAFTFPLATVTYFSLNDDGTNIDAWISTIFNDPNPISIYHASRTAFLTPSKVCIFVDPNNSAINGGGSVFFVHWTGPVL